VLPNNANKKEQLMKKRMNVWKAKRKSTLPPLNLRGGRKRGEMRSERKQAREKKEKVTKKNECALQGSEKGEIERNKEVEERERESKRGMEQEKIHKRTLIHIVGTKEVADFNNTLHRRSLPNYIHSLCLQIISTSNLPQLKNQRFGQNAHTKKKRGKNETEGDRQKRARIVARKNQRKGSEKSVGGGEKKRDTMTQR